MSPSCSSTEALGAETFDLSWFLSSVVTLNVLVFCICEPPLPVETFEATGFCLDRSLDKGVRALVDCWWDGSEWDGLMLPGNRRRGLIVEGGGVRPGSDREETAVDTLGVAGVDEGAGAVLTKMFRVPRLTTLICPPSLLRKKFWMARATWYTNLMTR